MPGCVWQNMTPLYPTDPDLLNNNDVPDTFVRFFLNEFIYFFDGEAAEPFLLTLTTPHASCRVTAGRF